MITLFENEINLKYITLPIIYILIGFLIYLIVKNILNGLFKSKSLLRKRHYQKRVDTLRAMLINIVKYIVIVFVSLAILTVFGIDIKSILTGLGITAAILGLAFQDIAKDLLAGIAIISEDQFEIGDTIEVNDFMGEVVSVGLKTTRIKDWKGRTKIIANHQITELINYNLSNNLAVVDIGLEYKENTEELSNKLNEICKRITKKLKNIKGEVKVLGINELGESSVVYRIVVETVPLKQFETERNIRRYLKEELDKENINIPFPQVEVHNGK